MSLINLSVKHGTSLDEARTRMEQVVSETRGRFGAMLNRVEWGADRSAVKLYGIGFEIEMRVDAEHVHVSGDMPLLGSLLGGRFLTGLKGIVGQTFQKRLT
jgi:hypothetical protein